MNITSIGGRELYSILLGKESPFGSSSSVELNETLEGSRIDISKVSNTDPTKFQVTDIQNDMSKDSLNKSLFKTTQYPKFRLNEHFYENPVKIIVESSLFLPQTGLLPSKGYSYPIIGRKSF